MNEVLADETERRHSERFPVHLWVEERDGKDVHYHQSANVSETGVYLRKTLAYDVGTRLRIRFSLPNDRHVIETEAEVVRYNWSDEDLQEMGMGLKFLSLTPPDGDRITRFIRGD